MQCFNLEIYDNAFKTKSDIEKYIFDLLKPLETTFIRKNTRIHLKNTSTGSKDSVSQIEGFSRMLWGLVALDKANANHLLWKKIREGLIHGTTPGHDDYFGRVEDFDQRIVEMAAIGYAFVLKPECIYEPLSDNEKSNLYRWLDQANERKAHNCNWKFFRVMVNIGFMSLGLDYSKQQMQEYMDDLDAYYLDKGWYRDGNIQSAHSDYYIPFAMHYYGLFYSKYMGDIDPERCEIYRNRAVEFSKEFIYWFSQDGSALPYGRSLAYRFAQVAFWSMMVFTDTLGPFTLGQIKGIILRHLRWWNQQPIYDSRGFLTIGYTYEQAFMTEEYIASGSVYWSLKTLIIGILPENHPFWQVEEEPFPHLQETHVQKAPRLVFKHENGSNQVLAYNSGNYHTNGHIHVECKYEKFVYSTLFGFSVPRSHRRLEFGAFDSTLAVSLDGMYYRHKDKSRIIQLDNEIIKMVWQPFDEVNITTYLILGYPWHIRLHCIETNLPLHTAEGGFAIGLESLNDREYEYKVIGTKREMSCITEVAYSQIVNLLGNQNPQLVKAASNTNIMNPRTFIPTLISQIPQGTHWIASYVEGNEGRGKSNQENMPTIVQTEEMLTVSLEIGKNMHSKLDNDNHYHYNSK